MILARDTGLMRDDVLMKAVLAFRDGRLGEAEAMCRRVLTMAPRFVPAMLLLGMIAARDGRSERAIQLLKNVIAADPDSVEGLNELANVLRVTGRVLESIAISKQAASLRPDDVSAQMNLGLAYLASRRPAEAAAAFERAIRVAPRVAASHLNLGLAHQMLGQIREAVARYRAAVALAPNDALVHARLGEAVLGLGDRKLAIESFQRVEACDPGPKENIASIAEIITAAGMPDLAESWVRRQLEKDPEHWQANLQLGRLLQQRGRFADAVLCFERVLVSRPDQPDAWLGIATVRRLTPVDAALVRRMEATLRRLGSTEPGAIKFHYALGKSYDDMNDPGRAIRHYDAANRLALVQLRAAGRAIDLRAHAANVDRAIETFTHDRLSSVPPIGGRDDLPVLIVGMIRSGTTLVEQILSSHPAVQAGGELRFWGEHGVAAGMAMYGALTPLAIAGLADDYLNLLRGLAPGARRVTDKMPTNFLLLGLIRLALPGVRIIHCRRSPVDTCLSIYTTPFSRSPDYAHDQETIVGYYQCYERLMAHWRKVLPATGFLEVSYEELVSDRDRVTHQLVEFCGLDWDEACLQPERNSRPVSTPSLWQARQPVYSSSVERWRRYEPWLGALRRLLPDGTTGATC